MFVDCRSKRDGKKIINKIKKLYDSMETPPPLGLRTMIIGMPNVGKSSLVNTLRYVGLSDGENAVSQNKESCRTGGQPGVTRSTSEIIRLSRDPEIMVYDTPGCFTDNKMQKQCLVLHWLGALTNHSLILLF